MYELADLRHTGSIDFPHLGNAVQREPTFDGNFPTFMGLFYRIKNRFQPDILQSGESFYHFIQMLLILKLQADLPDQKIWTLRMDGNFADVGSKFTQSGSQFAEVAGHVQDAHPKDTQEPLLRFC